MTPKTDSEMLHCKNKSNPTSNLKAHYECIRYFVNNGVKHEGYSNDIGLKSTLSQKTVRQKKKG